MDGIQEDIRKLVAYGVMTGLVSQEDVIFTANKLLELFELDELEEPETAVSMEEVELEEAYDREYRDLPGFV